MAVCLRDRRCRLGPVSAPPDPRRPAGSPFDRADLGGRLGVARRLRLGGELPRPEGNHDRDAPAHPHGPPRPDLVGRARGDASPHGRMALAGQRGPAGAPGRRPHRLHVEPDPLLVGAPPHDRVPLGAHLHGDAAVRVRHEPGARPRTPGPPRCAGTGPRRGWGHADHRLAGQRRGGRGVRARGPAHPRRRDHLGRVDDPRRPHPPATRHARRDVLDHADGDDRARALRPSEPRGPGLGAAVVDVRRHPLRRRGRRRPRGPALVRGRAPPRRRADRDLCQHGVVLRRAGGLAPARGAGRADLLGGRGGRGAGVLLTRRRE